MVTKFLQINIKSNKIIRGTLSLPQAECSKYKNKFAETFIKNNNQHKFRA
jgi:hypothetical protein